MICQKSNAISLRRNTRFIWQLVICSRAHLSSHYRNVTLFGLVHKASRLLNHIMTEMICKQIRCFACSRSLTPSPLRPRYSVRCMDIWTVHNTQVISMIFPDKLPRLNVRIFIFVITRNSLCHRSWTPLMPLMAKHFLCWHFTHCEMVFNWFLLLLFTTVYVTFKLLCNFIIIKHEQFFNYAISQSQVRCLL